MSKELLDKYEIDNDGEALIKSMMATNISLFEAMKMLREHGYGLSVKRIDNHV